MKKIDLRRLLLLFFFFSVLLLNNTGAQAQCPVTQTFNASGTWTCPANVTSITVECWGGGGAGGSALGTASPAFRAMGGAGAGGAYAKSTTISVTPGTTYTVTVGAGGVSSTANLAVVDGGDSWFNTAATILAKGGAGGQSVVASGSAPIGTGGAGSLAGSIGTTIFVGGSGATSTTTAGTGAGISPGGGGGAGTTANGSNGTLNTGGAGGATGGGAGGNGPTGAGTNGSAGSAAGGGGGGAWAAASTTQRTGGTGGNGRVIVSYTPIAAIALAETSGTANDGTICSGSPVTLTASGGTTYAWSTPPGGTTAAVTHSPTTTTTYTVTVTTSGCSVTASTTVTVIPMPSLTVVDPPNACLPNTVDITSSAVQTTNTGSMTKYYTTSALANAGGPDDVTNPNTISTSGTYYIRSENSADCYVVQPVVVTVNPSPSLTVVDPPAVCSPTTVDITSASVQTVNTGTTTKYYNSYTLALAGGASNVTTPAAVSASGIYYIRTELATGCYVVAPVTVTINTSPSFAPVAVQPTCLTNGSITFPELTGGTFTYSYTINGGAATSITPSGGIITITVPMGIQTASTYDITVTRTDVTPNCPTVKTVSIAAIPYCVTPAAQVADPCSCNNDQTADGSQTGTFNETVAVNGSGAGQTWTVTSVAPLVAGTAPTLTAGTVLSAVADSATNGIDDDGDGSTDEPDEANMYSVIFVHTDDHGYTATIEGPAAPGTAGNQILNISNVCKYPEIIFGANPLGTYCVSGTGTMPSISLSATEATSMAGTTTFSGSGVSGTTFTPTGAGTYTITATFTSTPGTGKGGTAGSPAVPNNSCITKESKTTIVTDSRCTAFPQ